MKKYSVLLGMLAVLGLMLVSGVLAQQPAPPSKANLQVKVQSNPSSSGRQPGAHSSAGAAAVDRNLLGSDVKNPQGQMWET